MLSIQTQLFEGQSVRLGYIDYEKDPEIESRWTHNSEFMRLLEIGPVYPLSAEQVKERNEALEKQVDKKGNIFPFRIRACEDNRLVGLAMIEWVEWTNGNGFIRLGIGDAGDRNRGWGSEALRMLLDYAFGELNLFRVSAAVQEYNTVGIKLFNKFRFTEEVRRRSALNRYGQRWDLLLFGLLRSEWQTNRKETTR
ncbi:MAG: GNAT family N-acetyltransferase [Anaerolineales bacterium]|nr:GNAT family N-acetyltransferase [Anaerolineales bacterium]